MTCIRRLASVLVAAFAMSVFAATGAQAHANFGPFYNIEKVGGGGTERLLRTQTHEIEAAPSEGNQVLTAGNRVVTCTGIRLKAGSAFTGSGNGLTGPVSETGSGSTEIVEYTGCTVTNNGVGCTVTEPITTKLLVNTLGYAEKTAGGEGKGKLLTIFEPAFKREFTTIHFAVGCEIEETQVNVKLGKNGVIAEDQTEGTHKPLEVNTEEPAVAEIGDVVFSTTSPGAIWIEANSVLTERTGAASGTGTGLEAFGVAAKLVGDTDVQLTKEGANPRQRWGVYTK